MVEEVKLIPPRPGCCRICAAMHKPEEPHEKDSLYYQNRFFKKHRRFPTWEDAMSHCSEDVKAAFREELSRRNIDVDSTPSPRSD